MTRLLLHVAGLTEADQILASVGLLGGRELSERLDVIDRQAPSDEAAAPGAVAALLDHDPEADYLPVAAPVGLRSTDPIGRVRAGGIGLTPGGQAVDRAEEATTAAFQFPRLALEDSAALLADEADRRDVARVSGSRANRGPSSPESDRCELIGVSQGRTPVRTEPSSSATTLRGRETTEGRVAVLTVHVGNIPPFAGTSPVAKIAQPLGRIVWLIERQPAYWDQLEAIVQQASLPTVEMGVPV